MKSKIAPILVCIASLCLFLTFYFSSCDTFSCHRCILKGENLDLPYNDGQVITFESDKGNTTTYAVKKTYQKGHDSYCGPLGSGSHDYCNSYASASLYFEQDSLFAEFISSQDRDPGYSVLRSESVLFFAGYESNTNGNNSITINSNTYNDLFYYSNSNAEPGDCMNFYYSITNGLVQFTIMQEASVEIWSLKN